MAGEIYKKPIIFAIMATVAILIGSVVTMAYPMLRAEMHPKLETLKPFTALQLAGRDIYQREGCVSCHTQTVRPLPSEVVRYGDYSKAGEFAYDHPFLWGSKRTGPDLAREGGLRPDGWHYQHYANPQALFPRSNMPSYGWLKGRPVDPAEVAAHLGALAMVHPELKYDAAAVQASVAGKDELDALVAYTQWLGHAVSRRQGGTADINLENPLAHDPKAVALGRKLFTENCAVCHGEEGQGTEGIAPSLMDDLFLGEKGDLPGRRLLRPHRRGLGRQAHRRSQGRPGRRHDRLRRPAQEGGDLVDHRLDPQPEGPRGGGGSRRSAGPQARAQEVTGAPTMENEIPDTAEAHGAQGHRQHRAGGLAGPLLRAHRLGRLVPLELLALEHRLDPGGAAGGRAGRRRQQHLHDHPLHGAPDRRGDRVVAHAARR